ncbi:MAG: hypothetical protein DRQ51_02800 [Gammaproteobacteria bacterium]|nr:MAG: hypothetical protein DRQ51_02800 [Gammaproteobacteria bacterium]
MNDDSHIDEINKRELYNTQAFDRAILTLSSSALGLSLTFFKFVVPVEKAICTNFILASWILLLIAILSILLTFVTGQVSLHYASLNADKQKKIYETKIKFWTKVTYWLSAIGGITFFVALMFLVGFVFNNI